MISCGSGSTSEVWTASSGSKRSAVELAYKDPDGRLANRLLYRHNEADLEIVEQGRPWSFDGDGALFRLVSEAHRIRPQSRTTGR